METATPQTTPSVSIQVGLLDNLMNLAGELVLCRNQLLQAINNDDKRLLEVTGQRIDMVTTEIQEQIMRTRMQPIDSLFEKLSSLVDPLARKAGKEVALSVEGETVEIDKTVMEAMDAPLRQLIGNAVAHGIETPDVRKADNKPPQGSIRLSASHEAGQVVLEVSDDGAGIDPDAMVRQAVAKGLISEQQGLDIAGEAEKMRLAFLPGLFEDGEEAGMFSRFSGLAGVKSVLEKVGGTIDMHTPTGQGVHARMKLPLTLSIVPSQIICLGPERFAVPQVNLSELLRIPAGQVKHMIETVGGAEVIRLRGALLPVIDLSRVLGTDRSFLHPVDGRTRPERRHSLADRRSIDHSAPQTSYEGPERRAVTDRRSHPESALNIAVVSTGKFKYGLVVDAMNDSEEIVVKPLGKHLKGCRGFAGATIMGDGQVALILDVASIGEMAALRIQDLQETAGSEPAERTVPGKKDARSQSYLFFSNSESERLAVPLDAVSRIEKVDADTIETVGGNRVLKYRGGSLPLVALEDAIMIDPLPQRSHYQVICFKVNGREVGLLATPPVDAADVAVQLDTQTLTQSGVMGSAVLMDETTLVLDIHQVMKNARPEFFEER